MRSLPVEQHSAPHPRFSAIDERGPREYVRNLSFLTCAMPMRFLLILLCVLSSACSRSNPEGSTADADRAPARAGEAIDPVRTAGQIASIRAAALTGDQAAIEAGLGEMTDDFRRSIKLADPAHAVDREAARQAVRSVAGVRSV